MRPHPRRMRPWQMRLVGSDASRDTPGDARVTVPVTPRRETGVYEAVRHVWSRVQAVKPASGVSAMSRQGAPLAVPGLRQTDQSRSTHLYQVSPAATHWSRESTMARRWQTTPVRPARLCLREGARPSAWRTQLWICVRAHSGHGSDARPLPPPKRAGAPSEWSPRRQSGRESRAVGTRPADGHPRRRRCGMGARNSGQIYKRSAPQWRRTALKVVEAGGDRTPPSRAGRFSMSYRRIR